MNTASSILNAVDFPRRYVKHRHAVVVGRYARILPAVKLSTGWPEVRILIAAALLVCGISLVMNNWPF